MSAGSADGLPRPQFLVTGATGFIGRRMVRRLVAEAGSQAVVCLSKQPASALEEAALAHHRAAGIRTIVGDLTETSFTVGSPPPVDIVFHLAANIDTDAQARDLRVNDVGTRNLLEWLRPVSSGMRIVYASSVAVHDRDRQPSGPIVETSPFVPRTSYGETKLHGEAILRDLASAGGYTWTVLRLPTVYGPGQKPGGLFGQLIAMARGGSLAGRLNWPGMTSILYVDDAAEVMLTLARDPAAGGEVFCVASDDRLTVGELGARIAAAVGRPAPRIGIPGPLLGLVRAVVWNRGVAATIPRSARLPFWRLSLIVSDGFWFDTAKFRLAYGKPLRSLDQGMADLLAEERGH